MNEIAPSIPNTVQAALVLSTRTNTIFDNRDTLKPHFRRWFFQRNGGTEVQKSVSMTPVKGDKSDKDSLCPLQAPSSPRAAATPTISKPSTPALSPQGYLDAMIRSRGYSTKRYKSKNSAYYNKPTSLQLASFDVYLTALIRKGNMDLLKSILNSGISPNACSKSGESLVHVACRQGDAQRLQLLLDAGASLQVADETGRTPLHEAFWAAQPSFDVVEMILQVDVRLLHMADCRSSVPLSYARKEHWAQWIAFFESKKEEFWPMRSISQDGEQSPPPLTLEEPNSRRFPNPRHSLTSELAKMVVSGRMAPEEAMFLKHEKERDEFSEFEDENAGEAAVLSYSTHSNTENSTDFTFSQNEMAEILAGLSASQYKTELVQTQTQEPPKEGQAQCMMSNHTPLPELLDEYDSEDEFCSDSDSEYSDSDCSDFDEIEEGMADLLADLSAINSNPKGNFSTIPVA